MACQPGILFIQIEFDDAGEIPTPLPLSGMQVEQVASQRPHGHRAVAMLGQRHGQSQIFHHQAGHEAPLIVTGGRYILHHPGPGL